MKKILIVILIMLTIGCSNKKTLTKEKQLDELIASNNYIIVDVRSPEEYQMGHVVDAINIPHNEIDENVDLDKSKTIIVYCQSGGRSAIATTSLKDLGYDVLDLGAYDQIDLEKE